MIELDNYRQDLEESVKRDYVEKIMEANDLDSNVLLPPRKRLLACVKNQNHGNGDPNPPLISTSKNNYGIRLNNLLSVHLSDNNNNLSQLEIMEASRSAAEIASKIAKAARAAAEKKAVMAAMAMAVAKKALELVAAVQKQETSSSSSKENKRKHIEVQMLYNNNNPTDETLKKTDKFGEVDTRRKRGRMKQKK